MTKMMLKSMSVTMLAMVFVCFFPEVMYSQVVAEQDAVKTTATSPQPATTIIAPAEAMKNYNPVPVEPSTVKNFPSKQPDWLDTSPKLPAGAPPVVRKKWPDVPPANQNLPPGDKVKTGEKQ